MVSKQMTVLLLLQPERMSALTLSEFRYSIRDNVWLQTGLLSHSICCS
jgi:hypothetical protein